MRFTRWVTVTLLLAVASRAAPAHHHHRHPDPVPSPWTDRRPVVKDFDRARFQIQRTRFWWRSPSYLETAPVVFPGPVPTLRPLFYPWK